MGGKQVYIRNSYSAGKLAATATGTVYGVSAENKNNGSVNMTNCFYDSVLAPDATTDPTGVTGKTTDEFRTGQVAWLLDHPDANDNYNAPSSTASQGVWGQKIARDATTGAIDASDASGGDVYPAFVNADHPKVMRMDYVFDADVPNVPASIEAADLFLNEGATVALAASPDDTPWVYYKEQAYENKITSPFSTIGAAQSPAGYYPVYVKKGIENWAEVGMKQSEADLRNTYWDASSGTWKVDSAPHTDGTAVLEGSDSAGYTLRSEEAFAWWAAVKKSSSSSTTTTTLAAATGHSGVFDFSGTAYGFSVDASASDSTVAEAKAKYSSCLPWKPITGYAGTFNAYGTRIENLYVNDTRAGLVADANGGSNYVFNGIDIASGYVAAESAGGSAGAIIGAPSTNNPVVLTDCRNAAAVEGSNAGGLIGESYGTPLQTNRCVTRSDLRRARAAWWARRGTAARSLRPPA
ncbi:MAG: hypothetical protein ACLSVD_06205 [Eggerthellaceae bacterium]